MSQMEDYQVLLRKFTEETRNILGNALVGVYLHGSAAMGCFNPAKSDLDLLIVVEDAMEDDVKRRYMDMVLRLNAEAPAKGLELSVLRREACADFVHPMPFELHFSAAHLDWYIRDPEDYVRRMKGVDSDLAAHITILHHKGATLWGAPIRDVFAPVSREAYMDSIWEDVADAPNRILRDPVYMTLNLCRVMAFSREGLILSKEEGGRWGLGNLPWDHYDFVKMALDAYLSDRIMQISEEKAVRFARFMLDRIGLRVELDTLSAELFLELYAAVGWESPSREQVAAALEHTLAAFTAYNGDHPVGMVRLLGDGGISFYLKDFAVLPDRRKAGVGKALMDAVEAYIRRTVKPGWAVSLELISTRDAIGFYRKMGFEERHCAWDGPGMFKMIR